MRVLVQSSTTCYHDEHDGQKYGSWSRHSSFTVDLAYKAGDNDKEPYGVEGFLIPDDSTHAYVLSMTYSTGDSFGTASGEGCVLGCFGSVEAADAAKKAVEENEDNYTINIVDELGRAIKISNPAAGYFETVETVTIQAFAL